MVCQFAQGRRAADEIAHGEILEHAHSGKMPACPGLAEHPVEQAHDHQNHGKGGQPFQVFLERDKECEAQQTQYDGLPLHHFQVAEDGAGHGEEGAAGFHIVNAQHIARLRGDDERGGSRYVAHQHAAADKLQHFGGFHKGSNHAEQPRHEHDERHEDMRLALNGRR